jgi:protein involved in polysaccharide export with SLBB domain
VDQASGKSLTRVSRLQLGATQLNSYVVQPRDELRFNQIFNDAEIGTVTVQGEVRFPGNYRLTRGERLSSLLERVGGLTNAAYPYGTIYLRKSVAALEKEGYARTAKEVQDQILSAMTRVGNDKLDPSTFTALQSFVVELRNQPALGRIAVQADPSILAARPATDQALEPGDVIYIPPRPSTVSVLGQVTQAGSFPYEADLSVDDYIRLAGGYSSTADTSNTFVVLPDGSARKMERSWLHFNSTSLPPGSSIVVPRDLTPFDLRQTVIDVSQILSQFAVSIASLAVLSKQ